METGGLSSQESLPFLDKGPGDDAEEQSGSPRLLPVQNLIHDRIVQGENSKDKRLAKNGLKQSNKKRILMILVEEVVRTSSWCKKRIDRIQNSQHENSRIFSPDEFRTCKHGEAKMQKDDLGF